MELRGAPRAMGEAHGEAWREEIHDFVARRLDHALDFVARHAPTRSLTRVEVIRAGRAALEVHRDYDSVVWSEFEGIARGADVDPAELLVCNGLTDIRDGLLLGSFPAPPGAAPGPGSAGMVSPGGTESRGTKGRGTAGCRAAEDTDGCTAFVAAAGATGNGPILGQTWDMHPDARDFLLVERRLPERGPAGLTLTTVGCLPLIGLNEHGVSIGTSNLMSNDARVGVSYLFTITRALRERTAADAASVVESTARMSGHNFLIVDHERALSVETTARRSITTMVTEERDGLDVLVRANHYVSGALVPLGSSAVDPAGSIWRLHRLSARLGAAARPLTADACWRLLGDATRGDGAVCNEDYECVHGFAATAATALLIPAEAAMLACAGGSRLGQRRRYALCD